MTLPTYIGNGGGAGGTAAVTPSLPASIATDDILIMLVETRSNQVGSIATPNGGTWTSLAARDVTGTVATRLNIFWSRYNGTQTAPVTNDSGDHQYAVIHAFRGVTTSDPPYEADAGNVDATSDTTLTVPGITTLGADRLVLICASRDQDDAAALYSGYSNGTLSNLTERYNLGTTQGNGGGLLLLTGEKATAGATGTTTATVASATSDAFDTFALIPSSSVVNDTINSVAAVSTAAVSTVIPTIEVTSVATSTAGNSSPTPTLSVTMTLPNSVASVVAPTINIGVISPVAGATADNPSPIPSIAITSTIPDATAAITSPVVSAGSNTTITSVVATATASISSPIPSISITSAVATATASSVINGADVTVYATVATSVSVAIVPTPKISVSSIATATAGSTSPIPNVSVTAVASAIASVSSPSISNVNVNNIISIPATASASVSSPTPFISITSNASATAANSAPSVTAVTDVINVTITSAVARATAAASASIPQIIVVPGSSTAIAAALGIPYISILVPYAQATASVGFIRINTREVGEKGYSNILMWSRPTSAIIYANGRITQEIY